MSIFQKKAQLFIQYKLSAKKLIVESPIYIFDKYKYFDKEYSLYNES